MSSAKYPAQVSRSPRLKASAASRTVFTFSCDIALLLCQARLRSRPQFGEFDHWRGRVNFLRTRAEQPPGATNKMTLEAAKRLAGGVPLRALSVQIGPGLGVDAGLGDRNAVEGAVELA